MSIDEIRKAEKKADKIIQDSKQQAQEKVRKAQKDSTSLVEKAKTQAQSEIASAKEESKKNIQIEDRKINTDKKKTITQVEESGKAKQKEAIKIIVDSVTKFD